MAGCVVELCERCYYLVFIFFFFSSRRRHTRCSRDWSSDVCSSDLTFLRCVRSARTARARLPCRPKWSGERPQDRQNNRRILRVSKRRERVMRRTVTPCVLVLFTLRLAGWAAAQAPAPAQERGARTPEAKSDEKCDAAAMKEESAATEHSIRVGGQTISYKIGRAHV